LEIRCVFPEYIFIFKINTCFDGNFNVSRRHIKLDSGDAFSLEGRRRDIFPMIKHDPIGDDSDNN
jgi:hypothetical protein